MLHVAFVMATDTACSVITHVNFLDKLSKNWQNEEAAGRIAAALGPSGFTMEGQLNPDYR